MYQKLLIVGYLGGDPEMRYTAQGAAVTSFSVATSRKWTGADGNQESETTWFRVSVWNKQAESCNQYLAKGSQVMVEGMLTPDRETGGPRVWTDRDGNPRASYEVRGLSVKFLSRSEGGGQGVQYDDSHATQLAEEEIPF